MLSGRGAVAVGDQNNASGDGAVAIGDPNNATGTGATAIGADNTATGDGAVATGDTNTATGTGANASGAGNTAAGDGAIAIGQQNSATGKSAIAMGSNATASSDGAVAIGSGSTASGNGSVALGAGATVNGHNQSTAIGANATTTADNQIMMGTKSETIIAPGMNSSTSRDRQVGRLGVVTSDNYGNIASDNGALYSELASLKTGIVMSMALGDPILSGDDRFAVKMNTSAFDGSYGIGVTAAAVLHDRDATLIVSGGVAWAQANEFGYSRDQGAARASMQISW